MIIEEELSTKISLLLHIERTIYNIYQRLYKLEASNMKNSTTYNKELDCLSIAREQEERVFNRIDKADYDKLIKVLKNTNFLKDGDHDLKALFISDERRKIGYRLYTKIENARANDPANIEKYVIDSYEYDEDEEYYDNNPVETRKMIKKDIELNEGLNYYFVETLLLFIEKLINNEEYAEFKTGLIKYKYEYAYISTFFEKTIIANNFSIKRPGMLTLELLKELIEIDETTFEVDKNNFGLEVASNMVGQLINISEKNITKKGMLKAIIKQLYVRIGITLMDENSICEVLDTLDEMTSSKRYKKTFPNSRLGRVLADECFSKPI